MASMNPGIILSGRAPDIMGSMARGAETGQFVNDARHTNAYRNALREYGPGAFQGDPNAMNQLAAYDPQGMLGMRTTMNAERRADSAEGRAAEAHRIRLAEYTSGLDAASAAAESERIVKGLSGAAFFYQRKDEQGYNAWLQQHGVDPAEYPMANFEAIAMGYAEVLEALKWVIERNAGPGQPQFRPATPEEAAQYGAAAGQFDLETGRFYPNNPATGMSLRTNPDGSVEFAQGPGVSGGQAEGGADFFSPGLFIDQIDATLNDPALDWSTGAFELAQNLPGTPMKRFQTRAEQLTGQAFMTARDALKGGGQITDYEGNRAAAAIGRLDTAQSPQDYRSALEEVRAILVRAMARPQGWVDTSVGKIYEMSAGELSELINAGNLTDEERNAARERLIQIRDRGQ